MFQSPCGDFLLPDDFEQFMLSKTGLFQSPCGDFYCLTRLRREVRQSKTLHSPCGCFIA